MFFDASSSIMWNALLKLEYHDIMIVAKVEQLYLSHYGYYWILSFGIISWKRNFFLSEKRALYEKQGFFLPAQVQEEASEALAEKYM